MARSQETGQEKAQEQGQEKGAEQEPQARAKASKKSAKKAAKKTAKKTAKRTSRRATSTAKKTGRKPAASAAAENPFASFDRSRLTDKMRVFQLAKELEVSSKDLIVALSQLGMVKVAQSSLTRAESEQLLDALSASHASPEATEAARETEEVADEKIRERVRKDVANEITQIERKVEAELTDRSDGDDVDNSHGAVDERDAVDLQGALALDDGDDVGGGDDGADEEDFDALSDPEDIGFDFVPASASASASALVSPEDLPAPTTVVDEEESAAYAPVFKAPGRGGRRRARRSTSASTGTSTSTSTSTAAARDAMTAELEDQVESVDVGAGDALDVVDVVEAVEEPKAIKGSSRLEAQRRRRSEKREEERKRSRIVSQAEFLARRESVERTMVVRERQRHDGTGTITQVGVLEDGLLVEHFVTSDQQVSLIGNIYLGRVQNVLPSMEAAFIDIGLGRNGVLYAGEVDWKSAGLGGRSRRIEHALKSGDQVVVQVTKDPVGHKGARLTTQISLAGRYLVYVPGGRSAGISRKLPAPERKRLKEILNNVVPGKGGAIIRTAAEGVAEEAIAADVNRLHTQWEAIQERAEKEKRSRGAKPVTLYEEPNLLVKVVRDLFNEDFSALVVDGRKPWNTVHSYVESVAPDLLDRLEKYDRAKHDGNDAFEAYRVDEQIHKALSRFVWLPSGGSLIFDRTEAMTVIDVNTGKFTGSGGSLEETVTSNNLEAAEEIVRQIRLRDIGGIIIIDFIDMILPENQDLVLRRLTEALGRDRTRHQVSEVTSLGLVQMTRKRLGTGLLETFAAPCEHCAGRGVIVAEDPVEPDSHADRPRVQKQQPRRLGEDELDQIAGSVVVADEAAPEDADESEAKERHEDSGDRKRSASRRRGRRGGSRGRGRSDEQAAPPAADTAGSTAQTFEEAVEEFEASPRRKRRTRGNSRSDHRPREEDFRPHAHADADPDGDESAQLFEEKNENTRASTASRRGRELRRATRKSTASLQDRQSQPGAGSQRRKLAGKAGRSARAARGDQAQRVEQTANRRGRRRATRRSSSS